MYVVTKTQKTNVYCGKLMCSITRQDSFLGIGTVEKDLTGGGLRDPSLMFNVPYTIQSKGCKVNFSFLTMYKFL